MPQRLHTRSIRNHRTDHGPRLAAAGAADAKGVAASPHIGARAGHLRLLTGAARRESFGELVPDRRGQPHVSHSETLDAPIRVLIADGQALVRAGYRALLESDTGIEVAAEASSSWQAVARATEIGLDVALLDQGLPGLDDAEATSAVVSRLALAGVAVMLMASGEGDERVVGALRAGAVGVLRKDDQPATLIESVQLLAKGQALLPASAVRRMLDELRPRSLRHTRLTQGIEELTEREREVVALAGEGLTNGEIAARLVISPATAKTHVSRAMIKLHARHRAELVISAYENGLVVPPTQV
jgi:DNA-binding NarL/FixJ family response regulator